MSTVDILLPSYEFNRGRSLALLETIEKEPDPLAVLGWRPGPGRAHIGWQLMHIFVTEEIFATERLNPDLPRQFEELWPRFRGGSTPDDNIPTPGQLREVAQATRERLVQTLKTYGDDRLTEIPAALASRGWDILRVLHVIGFHESHHQGQAHITLNLYKASKA